MTLDKYDPKLLEMMYFLVNNKRFMNSIEISKNFKPEYSKTGKVTDRSVRRWFKYLHENDFWYFPHVRSEMLGLLPVCVLIGNPREEKILDIIPHLNWVIPGTDLYKFGKCLLAFYLIPPSSLDELEKFFQSAKEKGLLGYYKLVRIRSPIAFYSPFHKIIKQDGKIEFPEEGLDHSFFSEILDNNLKKEAKVEVHSKIKENPFIVPLTLHHGREHLSSREAWYKIKERLGDDVWNYVSDIKKRWKKSDGVGIKFVQDTMKDLHQSFDEFFQQICIHYIPFCSSNSICFVLFLKVKDKSKIVEMVEEVSKRTIYTMVYPPGKEEATVILYVVTNMENISTISSIIAEYIDSSSETKFVWRDYTELEKYFGRDSKYRVRESIKHRYNEIFDPQKAEWKYESNKYLDELNKLKTG